MDKVTIITVCYNSEKYITQTIESVLNQSYRNIEYVIIDGKSTDGTMDIIDKYKSSFGERLKVVSEKDKGIYDAMNKGVALASGEMIGIVNSDDFLETDAVENVMAKYKPEEPYQVIYGMVRGIQEEEEEKVYIYNHQFLKKRMIGHPGCFVSKKTYEEFGGFDTRYRIAADYDFLLRLFLSNKVLFNPLYKVVTNFRSGGASASRRTELEVNEVKFRYGIITKKEHFRNKLMKKLAIGILGEK